MTRRFMMILLAFSLGVSAPCALADGGKDHICFRTLDADRDGRVTFREFAAHYGNDTAGFQAADADRDGTLTHEEYHGFLGHGAN